ncbi:Protein-S-isoprenylcysteine O-methyltransferase Ste14 [Armatimonadetes bacterium GBS]|mgnify:FL=1|nr:hypothetical protein HRbin14_01549 [bacterium HR14]GIV13466.1 MAG: isoprenylcysteine carboxyl methyltransferase [Fimbriimonadales bacterium]CUU05783.1 Protein-S-isoprenylcysteine O-methyltransferase Ste14 [Armatimonadetes bacterium GBS]CUU36128.1 Protein-S-isoprenylcysteine O-methyltransferase Ste14 [Armatimonadetes bacterium GXS]
MQAVLFVVYGAALYGSPSGEWGFWRWLGVPMLAGAVILLAPSVWAHGRKLTPLPEPNPRLGLLQTGVYASIRHPMYLGLMLLTLGLAIFTMKSGALGAALALVVFFNLKAREEERRLLRCYPEYADYMRRTGRFLPRWR